jgi:uncharacterized protein YcbX
MQLSRIIVYPIKSLDGVAVSEVRITSGGALAHDRSWAILDREGRKVNAKRYPQIQRLRTTYSCDFTEVEIGVQGESNRATFSLVNCDGLTAWLGAYLGFPVQVVRDDHLGFPDDSKAWGPTLISQGSLNAVAEWFPDLSLDNLRRRFRTNLELDVTEPFWEDRLYQAEGQPVPFKIGAVRFQGHNPCSRCAVPARDPDLGTPDAGFQAEFTEMRKRTLPNWADWPRFNHFYRLAVNTSIDASEAGLSLHLADKIEFD